MVYYRLEPDIYGTYGVDSNPPLPDGANFLTGHRLRVPVPSPLVFVVNNPASDPPKHLLGDSIPLISEYFIESLRNQGVDNFETYPAILRSNKTTREWTNYYAFNVLGLVAAADMGASKHEVIMPGGDGEVPALVDFTELVFDKSKTQDLTLFRLLQNPTQMFLIDRVVNGLKQKAPAGGWGITTFKVEVL